MESQKPSPADEISGPSTAKPSVVPPHTWEEDRASSASGLFELLNQISVNKVEPQVLSSSDFLEFLRKQGPEGRLGNARSIAAGGNSEGLSNKSQSMHNKEKNQDYQSVAIDQCDITSSVDYGSRDFYRPSTNTSETPYIYKESQLDELYKTSTDTRGNWWEGSFYY